MPQKPRKARIDEPATMTAAEISASERAQLEHLRTAANAVAEHVTGTAGAATQSGTVSTGGGAVVAAQVKPGCYILLDQNDKEIGAMFCLVDPATAATGNPKNLEYYGMKSLVGGAGTLDKTIVFKLQWRDPYFADLPAFKKYCTTNSYNLHILATCDSKGW